MYSYSEEIDVNLLSLEEKDGINLVEKLVLNPRIAHKRSQGIDKILEKELKDSAIPSTKVLILGSGDSGKSTFVRHMRISYFKTFTLEELGYFKFVIHGNIISVLKKLAEKLELLRNSNDEFKFSPGSEGNQPCDKKHFQILQQFVLKKDLPPEIVTAIQMIWNDENIKSCYEQRRQLNLEIQETAAYYLSDLPRILSSTYTPSEQDILCLRNSTKQVTETVITTKFMKFKLFDAAGQTHLRNSWAAFFDDAATVLFVCAISSYDQNLIENPAVNRLVDAVTLFETIVNNKILKKAGMILFFNKMDIFQEKIKTIPIQNYFNDYLGGSDLKLAKSYFKNLFTSKATEKEIEHVLFTTSTDPVSMKKVVSSVTDVIIRLNMKCIVA